MKCYNCGCELNEKDFCTGCGADVGLYKRIIHIANRYYNDGLARANVRDLSGAITCLRQCLKFDKNHIEARNLLGLVYFEMGEVVAALSEWVISKNLRPKKNLADDYIEAVQSNPARLDTINQTIKKYNLALHYCQQDSKDLAVIQLKKVLSLNPRLVQGHQLLALLYMDAEEWEKARKELTRCVKIDTNNMTTLSYLKYVNNMIAGQDENGGQAIKKKQKKEEVIKYQSGNETIIQPLNVREQKGASSIINIIIGLLIGLSVCYFLILPARIQSARNSMDQQIKVISEKSDAKSARISELEQQIEDARQSSLDMQSQIDEYTGENGIGKKSDTLLQIATDYLNDSQNTDALAEELYAVDTAYIENGASDSYKQLYTKLMGLVSPQASEKLFKDGTTSLNQSDYTTAITKLQMAWFYNKTLESPNPEILYQLGQAYEQAGETNKARDAFGEIAANYANTQAATKANEQLDQLGASVDSSDETAEDQNTEEGQPEDSQGQTAEGENAGDQPLEE